MPFRSIAPVAFFGAGVLASTAGRAAPLDPSGPTALAATANHVFSIEGNRLIVIDQDGARREGCPGFWRTSDDAREAPSTLPRRASPLEADDVLALSDLDDDDQASPEAEDALEDALDEEGLGEAQRRHHAAPPAFELRALAATGDDDVVWIATSAGLVRFTPDGCAFVGLGDQDLLRIAAGSGIVAVASERLLWRFEPSGGSFTVLGGLPAPPRAVAVALGGAVVVGDDDGLTAFVSGAPPRQILAAPVDAAISCGDLTLAFARDGVYRVDPTDRLAASPRSLRVAARPPARTLTCGLSATQKFIAAGIGVWTSPDGIRWDEDRRALGLPITMAVTLGSVLWTATEESGPVPLSRQDAGNPRGPGGDRGSSLRPVLVPQPARLALPRVTLAFIADRTSLRTQWQGFILIAFPFGRATGRPVTWASALAAEIAEHDAELAGEVAALSDRSDEEGQACERALEDERRALRP